MKFPAKTKSSQDHIVNALPMVFFYAALRKKLVCYLSWSLVDYWIELDWNALFRVDKNRSKNNNNNNNNKCIIQVLPHINRYM